MKTRREHRLLVTALQLIMPLLLAPSIAGAQSASGDTLIAFSDETTTRLSATGLAAAAARAPQLQLPDGVTVSLISDSYYGASSGSAAQLRAFDTRQNTLMHSYSEVAIEKLASATSRLGVRDRKSVV